MGECRNDRPYRNRAERREADHSFNSEQHGKLGEPESSIPKRYLQRMPPYRLSSASLAQLLRPLPGMEKAAMSSYETTLLRGLISIVAGFLQ
jgi:hypothetical protein